ncbi:non-histone chromosomal protein 6 [Moniliophthora roreri MCA 2997]|uniref:Non-histone chromosomal protein 6 n=1 Tax=Moniliophthora roreri (strain MCA 2997) TaxID=1381753 RepID=V2XHF7_MONRO|nr:non-histone chromosomal protein 6 [Moniliophthora roreri MCA 2997]
MADDVVALARANYEKALHDVADAMRNCAEMAEHFAAVLSDPDATHSNGNNLKRKKGKGKDGVEDEGGKRKRTKDPNAPKRPASSYIIYQNEVRQTIKEQHPNLSPAEIRTLISQEWAKMSEEEKEYYRKNAQIAKDKYTAEKAAYAARSPEEVAAAEAKAKASRDEKEEKHKSAEKVESPAHSSPEPESAPAKATSSVPDSEESASESGSEEEEEEEEDEVDADADEEDEEEEEEAPPTKKQKVEKPTSKAKKSRT